ncbi:MAG TPA: GGDEF domain-containing protein [Dongiaceae bacterium]|nr:GGDEF domain-containing protein [Dongiaceae bacterium]
MKVRSRTTPGTTRTAAARPAAGLNKASKPSSAHIAEAAAAAPADRVAFLGLSEGELSPNVRLALQTLLDEVSHLRDELDQTRKRIAHLEQLADEDAMLPISNRRAFVRELTRMISYAERYNSTGSVLYFDVNGMKEINDRYGHAAGDAALAHFARLLVENVRDTDVVGRLGGDEFGVILAQADERQAQEKASTLVRIIDRSPFTWQGEELTLSCAVGIHQFLAQQSAETAITAADANMYKVKRRHYEKKAKTSMLAAVFETVPDEAEDKARDAKADPVPPDLSSAS